MLHQFVDVDGLVEGFRLHVAGKLYQLTGQKLLGNDVGMILDVGRRSHAARQLGNIHRTADILQVTRLRQLVGHGNDVDRLLGHRQVAYGGIDLLVAGFIETLGIEGFAHDAISVLVYHQGTQHRLLYLESLRLQVTIRVVNGLWCTSLSTISVSIIVFRHSCTSLGLQSYKKLREMQKENNIFLFISETEELRRMSMLRKNEGRTK